MTYFSQNPISSPTPFGPTPPRNPREAADAIMAYLDREAAGTSMPRTPFAPFLAETYEPPVGGGEGGYAPAASPFAETFATEPIGIEEEEPEALLPYPDPRTDDERIENVLWLLEKDPVESRTADHGQINETFRFDKLTDFSDLIQLIVNEGKKPGGRFNFLVEPLIEAARDLERTNSRRLVADLLRKQLRELEPNNPLAHSPTPVDYDLTDDDLLLVKRENDAAQERAKLRMAFRARSLGGESIGAIRGRAIHRLSEAKRRIEGKQAEVSLPGVRMDGLDVDEASNRANVIEVKPGHPAAVRRGEWQADRGASIHQRETGRPTTYSVDTYDVDEANRWLLGPNFFAP